VEGDVVEEVESGEALLFAPFTRHSIRNAETSTDDLVFLTVYWMPGENDRTSSATTPEERTPAARRALVCATPPTPNGDLHLGHLSGPYLAGDIWRRFLRAKGVEVCYGTRTD